MDLVSETPAIIEFGHFRIVLHRRELLADGLPVELGGRAFGSTILRVFHSGGMPCHLVRHHIVVPGQPPARDYRLTWCRTPSGEWKTKG
jgi:hypothetical protein